MINTSSRTIWRATTTSQVRNMQEAPEMPECREVWSISTRPLREAHFAAFPLELPLRCISAGCRPGGTVLDMFAGAGTTGIAARQLDRQAQLIELVPAYCEIAERRLQAEALRVGRWEAEGG